LRPAPCGKERDEDGYEDGVKTVIRHGATGPSLARARAGLTA